MATLHSPSQCSTNSCGVSCSAMSGDRLFSAKDLVKRHDYSEPGTSPVRAVNAGCNIPTTGYQTASPAFDPPAKMR